MDTIRPEAARPTPYFPAQRREWIVCDEPGIEGLAILVRTSITNAEQEQLQAEINEITGPYTEQWFARPPEERDASQTPYMMEREVLARQILDWNVSGTTVDGEKREIAAPAINGAKALDFVDREGVTWMFRVVLGGYLVTGKVERSPSRSTDSGGPSGAAPDPETPTLKKSTRQKN